MRETEDELARNMLVATASQINCVNGLNGDNPTELNRADIDTVVQTLLGNDAMMISDNIEGSLKFGTAPVREAFWAMMKTDILDDLEAVQGFLSQAQYPSNMNVLDSEWGSVGNIRFTYSSRGSTTANGSLNGATVYNIFVAAQESYACIDLTRASAQFIYTPPGGPTDPLRRLQLGAYKFAQVPRILNDSWIFNLRCTHSV
jgi:N4-gp56 family major capsid protein